MFPQRCRSASKLSVSIIAIVATAFLPALATAQNLSFLKSAPVGYFDDKDVAILLETIDATLDEQQPHAIREWKNPDTGNSGKVEVLGASKGADGTPCKRLRISNLAHNGVSSRASYTFCKETDKWIVVPRDAK
jgi:hypothetical protein